MVKMARQTHPTTLPFSTVSLGVLATQTTPVVVFHGTKCEDFRSTHTHSICCLQSPLWPGTDLQYYWIWIRYQPSSISLSCVSSRHISRAPSLQATFSLDRILWDVKQILFPEKVMGRRNFIVPSLAANIVENVLVRSQLLILGTHSSLINATSASVGTFKCGNIWPPKQRAKILASNNGATNCRKWWSDRVLVVFLSSRLLPT
jgi:hypothetical protein